jgi:membrane protease YdiL (CAAX protease family)
MKTNNNPNHLWFYFLLTFVIMLLTWGVMAVFQIPGASAASGAGGSQVGGLILLLLGGFSPTFASLILTARFDGKPGLQYLWNNVKKTGFGGKWYAVLFFLPLLIVAIRVAIYTLQGNALIPSHLIQNPASLIGFTLPILIIGPISEEFGWRGYALERAISRFGIVKGNLLLGVIWAFWHLPLFFIAGTIQQINGNPPVEFSIFFLLVLGLNIFFNWLYIQTGRSLFAAMLVHFVFNWLFSFSNTFMNVTTAGRLINALAYAMLGVLILTLWIKKEKCSTNPRSV